MSTAVRKSHRNVGRIGEREKENESQQQAIAAGDQHNLVVGLSITLERISWGRRMWPQAIRSADPAGPAGGEAPGRAGG